MFLPENQKKLTNVCIVTLKKFNKKYELAVYPNKLYEYRHNQNVPLRTILHSENIYRSVANGEVCSESDLDLFQAGSHEEIIHYILQNGHEQKHTTTYQHELTNIEKQIVDLVQTKVLYNNAYVAKEHLLAFIKKVWNIKNVDPKRQVSGIIRKLVEIGFERVTFKVSVEGEEKEGVEFPISEGVKREADFFVVKSDYLPEFIEYCETKGLKCVVTRNDIVEEEEIC